MIPYGCIINTTALFLGGVTGALLGKRVPEQIKTMLPKLCGVIALAIGIVLFIDGKNLSAVALALILGTIAGNLLKIEIGVSSLVSKLQRIQAKGETPNDEKAISDFSSLLMLFCTSGTGIFGALNAGISGDHSILIVKSVLDFFTILIFATTGGFVLLYICIPQIAIYMILFYGASFIMPLLTDVMISDFKACGGAIVLCIGLRLLNVLPFKEVNILPSLLLVLPVSYLWSFM